MVNLEYGIIGGGKLMSIIKHYIGSEKQWARIVAERMLGRTLLPEEQVHHQDGNHFNNEPSNLFVCKDQSHHFQLHRRKRALQACGHADWRKCWICGEYDDPKNLRIYGSSVHHRSCYNEYRKKYSRRKYLEFCN